ncbi:MAG: acyl-phosphate glycerol 3-phosphate acyltransferase [Pelagibacterales bacterium]|nr:acyl-phosphate glycerol 3-phosphate acyltransferase [Pelagibacterales bacterium]|tara:strand:- start:2886 stop:3566 length:681 start_codon:yes stop_codon:yes gene_type:complete
MTILLNSVLELLNYPSIIVFCIISFIIGSIPFGLIVTKISGYGDIRKIGSGNIGATNVLRTGNKLLALLTLLLDISKSFAFLYFVKINFILILEKELLIILYVLISILSLLGHMFSPFLLLKGGKGIATSAGILFFMNWIGASVILFVWLIVALKYKTSSLGALSASFIAPIIFWFLYKINVIENLFYVTNISILEVYLILIISILIWIKHISNIKRLISGTESKI